MDGHPSLSFFVGLSIVISYRPLSVWICATYDFLAELDSRLWEQLFLAVSKVRMVNTRLMAAQHNHINGVNGLEASISDRAHPETPKVNMLERKIQGLTTNIQLLMEQN